MGLQVGAQFCVKYCENYSGQEEVVRALKYLAHELRKRTRCPWVVKRANYIVSSRRNADDGSDHRALGV